MAKESYFRIKKASLINSRCFFRFSNRYLTDINELIYYVIKYFTSPSVIMGPKHLISLRGHIGPIKVTPHFNLPII